MTLFGKKENDGTNEQQTSSETLGSRIAAARKRKGYTQEEFSDLLGITPQAVSKWENDLSCPDILSLPKISELLDISIDELLTGKTQKAEKEPASTPKIPAVNTDISKLKLRIKILPPNKKPVNVTVPLSFAKRIAKIGNGISGIMGQTAIDSDKMEQIIDLVEGGATGELLNIVAEDETNIIIEIS